MYQLCDLVDSSWSEHFAWMVGLPVQVWIILACVLLIPIPKGKRKPIKYLIHGKENCDHTGNSRESNPYQGLEKVKFPSSATYAQVKKKKSYLLD